MALLAGKTAIITGGARGLGSAIATAMAAEGAHAVVVDRNSEAASELVAQIKASGGSATSEILDIGDREAVKAFVVAADGSDIDEETLIEFCREHLARYKCPNKVLFVDELPRNAGGKVLKTQLREMA